MSQPPADRQLYSKIVVTLKDGQIHTFDRGPYAHDFFALTQEFPILVIIEARSGGLQTFYPLMNNVLGWEFHPTKIALASVARN